MQFTRFCRDFDLVAKYAFSQAPSCTNFLPPGSASDSRTGAYQALPLVGGKYASMIVRANQASTLTDDQRLIRYTLQWYLLK